MTPIPEPITSEIAIGRWAASGALALTGRPDGPMVGPPSPLVRGLVELTDAIADRTAALGDRVEVDGLEVLTQRAAILGLSRRGTTSCGGATRLLPGLDGHLAVALARPTDIDLVPAWLEIDPTGESGDPPWDDVARAVARHRVHTTASRAWLLGLPVSILGEVAPPDGVVTGSGAAQGVIARAVAGPPAPVGPLSAMRVVDLSSLWAGPLCGQLLGLAGADVVKVESTGRPDGGRLGPGAFFDLVNSAKRSVALDLGSSDGVAGLRDLLASADVVIEASRPRALEQLGFDAAALVAGGGPRVWVSITGYGRSGPGRDRVGFGDDAAVAGGLVVHDGSAPLFCADAVADPLSGLVATAACLAALAAGGRWLLDVSMAAVSASFAGPTLTVSETTVAAAPRHPAPTGHGPALGAHTAAILGDGAGGSVL